MRMKISWRSQNKVQVFLPPEHIMNYSSTRPVRRIFMLRELNGIPQPWVWEILNDQMIPIGQRLYRYRNREYTSSHLRLESDDDNLLVLIRREYHRRYQEHLNTWDQPWYPDGRGDG